MEGKSESAIDQTVPNQSSKSNTLDILNVVFNSLSKIISPAIFRTLYDYLIYSNYCSNIKNENSKSTTTHNEYVHGQRNHKYEGFKYGFFNASYNSCEVIAIHNVKVYLGIDTTLPDTIKDIQLLGGMWLYGVFGSYPHISQRAFDYYEIDYTKIDSMSDMTENGMYLLTYCKDANLLNGIHTVAVEHKNDKYMAYNLYGSTADVDEFEVSDYENGFICGYFVGQNN